jgi:glycolate oxidase
LTNNKKTHQNTHRTDLEHEKENVMIRIREDLERLIGKLNVSSNFFKIHQSCLEEVTKKVFGMDKLGKFVVARPRNISQVQKIVRYANKNRIYVFVRGGGSSYFGGELPTRQGIVIETTGLNQIKKLDQDDGYVVCEAGVTVQELNDFLKKRRFWWPHNPGSRESATVGGSISSLGVGTFSTRFGYASDSVLSLTVVTPRSDIIEIGSNTKHDMSSYNLLDVFTSSEGTLGIIVKTKLKVFRVPSSRRIGLFSFNKLEDAVRTAQEIIVSGIYPESLEIEDVRRFTLEGLAPVIDLKSKVVRNMNLEGVQAVLFVNCSGSKEITNFHLAQIEHISSKNNGRNFTKDQQRIIDLYWRSKTEISSWAPRENTKFKVHTCVPAIPLNKIPRFEKICLGLLKKYPKLKSMGIGYYLIVQNHECTVSARVRLDESDRESIHQYELFTADLAGRAVELGGSPASTFGVGAILTNIVDDYTSPSWRVLSSKLKQMIDPNSIFGPDKKGS